MSPVSPSPTPGSRSARPDGDRTCASPPGSPPSAPSLPPPSSRPVSPPSVLAASGPALPPPSSCDPPPLAAPPATCSAPLGGPPPTAPQGDLPPEAYAVALASLPGAGPSRLLDLLRRHPPRVAWERVLAGTAVADRVLAGAWRAAAARADPGALWARCRAAGIGVTLLGSPGYPTALAADPTPPALVFLVGDPGALGGPRVAVIGTRRCTRYGRDVAAAIGRELAEAGVTVVSGLALGIDGAAHAGALAADGAPVVGVVGSGLDVVYPRRHAALWRDVAARGLLMSEAPPGARPEPWRFPARNRLIADLADVVVVVESHAAGGSLLTVNEAMARDRPVMAVPGPVTSRASEGTNELLASGAHVARDTADVLALLGMEAGSRRAPSDDRAPPAPDDAVVLDAVGWQPATTDEVATAAGLDLAGTAVVLSRLAAAGWVAASGAWWERVGPPGPPGHRRPGPERGAP